MHYYLFLRVEGLYAKALVLDDPALASKLLVIHRDKLVLDVNESASRHQIYRGMPLAEAKAILQGAAFIAWEEEPYRAASTEWLDLCTEVSDVIQPDRQHTVWIDLSLHHEPASLAQKVIGSIKERTGLSSTGGIGCSKWIAKLACEYACAQGTELFQARSAAEFLSPLKTRCLAPVDKEHRQRLEFLGYATVGEVAQVPLNVLRSQFGDSAAHIRSCAKGGFFEAVEAQYPPMTLSDRLVFDGCVEDLQVLDEGLRMLAGRLSQKLRNDDKMAKNVVVTLEHEDQSTTVLKRSFTKPIQNYASALASLRLVLTPLPEKPVTTIRVRLESVSVSKRIQHELTGRTSSGEREKGAMAAFQHLRTVFGDASIQTGSEIVDPRRKQVLRAWKDATGWT